MLKRRKNYTPEEKVAILKKHFVEKETLSDLCEKKGKKKRGQKTINMLDLSRLRSTRRA